jgi:hypothetical protein
MPRINFSFQGWINGADITVCYDSQTGEKVNVSNLSVNELTEKLNLGELHITLSDYLNKGNTDQEEVDIFDFDNE